MYIYIYIHMYKSTITVSLLAVWLSYKALEAHEAS